MKYCSCLTIQKRASARSVRIEDWVHRLALLTLAFSGFYGSYLQAYQGAQIAPIDITIVDLQGGVMADVDVVLMKDDQILTRTKTGPMVALWFGWARDNIP